MFLLAIQVRVEIRTSATLWRGHTGSYSSGVKKEWEVEGHSEGEDTATKSKFLGDPDKTLVKGETSSL